MDGRKKKVSLILDWIICYFMFVGGDIVVDIWVERIVNLKSDYGVLGVNEVVVG